MKNQEHMINRKAGDNSVSRYVAKMGLNFETTRINTRVSLRVGDLFMAAWSGRLDKATVFEVVSVQKAGGDAVIVSKRHPLSTSAPKINKKAMLLSRMRTSHYYLLTPKAPPVAAPKAAPVVTDNAELVSLVRDLSAQVAGVQQEIASLRTDLGG